MYVSLGEYYIEILKGLHLTNSNEYNWESNVSEAISIRAEKLGSYVGITGEISKGVVVAVSDYSLLCRQINALSCYIGNEGRY